MRIFDPVAAVFGALVAHLANGRTLEHQEIAGLCRALALITDPGTGTGAQALADTNQLTDVLRAICRRVFDDIPGSTAADYTLFAREMFVRHAEHAGLGSIFGRFSNRPGH